MPVEKSPDSFTFTVGKLDAGMAILLGERAHLIEFPSILLPPGATTGSIVNIAVHQNHAEEKKRETEFWSLQEDILNHFGQESPEPPKLSVRNITQTSVTLEWPPIKLATAKLRSLDIYRNGERLSSVPSPLTNTSTKHSGMDINTEYSFQLILRTTAGTFPSNVLKVKTHTMSDTSGISVCFGNVQDPVLLENAKLALREMGAKWSDTIQIDTSHFVCTTPAATPTGANATGNASSAPGVAYQRALQLSIPVVQPHWILACHAERRMVPIASFYLGATITPTTATSFNRPQSMSQASIPHTPSSPTPNSGKGNPASYRASMPPPSRVPETPPVASAFVNQPAQRPFEPTLEEREDDLDAHDVNLERSTSVESSISSNKEKRKSRMGSINKAFKFPPTPTTATSNTGTAAEAAQEKTSQSAPAEDGPVKSASDESKNENRRSVVDPENIEVPAPPPMEKEKTMSQISLDDDGEDELGDTVDIPLN
ncbi:Cell fusion protein cfr1 [Psilocybe cubensis]|uniref:Chitin biosynthesis protein CHS5 n=2 Tax=Psilocybe cubensis TaxID=181762 RepID=A0A8H7XZG5_PSICU|nr:Cell fusion protein cfr1 [Psilocybe cubensis]KAH9482152.1 Cell fusion protein cfr1 [Psilocybe cubensis]